MIALFGGTFDPPHLGHLNMAARCIDALGLHQLKLLPCAIPVHKQRPKISDEHRLSMLAKVISGHEKMTIDTRELLRQGPSYTLLTLRELRAEHPKAAITFLMGMDSFNNLHTWFEWREITTLCHLVVYQRPGETCAPSAEVAAYLTKATTTDTSKLHKTLAGHCYFLSGEQKDIASSTVRAAISQQNVAYLEQWLPNSVIDYINSHGLYAD
ncbi:nicotinate-nucleotide adenylyltransferase [Pseudoalteromonas peptidolytica]|uniref:Probable nicotinate-nucleotide adenylyltransferase n=1 Tax=Pseudoalteromonas peptidolytica F12-50-A1 TaxID=1315280 RepID=A0A8I0MUE6_9GAMM|nr:nicotinate-nucleotide adenylyltransferase [Pseudoalteromonas peptidolytica]MBE0345521.1 nicotinate-nucleotide adenylyltransferase [Pseudoalteromonas peptidolytica F12-50-A1]NLR13464.1 nicotinate-nucleotide adenylyltransferase [Pseudoalteromonas peptidolytica]GEK08738.1 putative nicotinate-nucleotide adenylyltransferase [Pseudoalteromonas peptidolytica]